jgi:hypothetical protein
MVTAGLIKMHFLSTGRVRMRKAVFAVVVLTATGDFIVEKSLT